MGRSCLQQLAECGRVGPPIGTCSWASLAFTHNSQVDFKHAHGFLKDCFIFSDARPNGFIDSSFRQGCMRWLLFSLAESYNHKYLPCWSTGEIGTKLIAFPSLASERQPDSCYLLFSWVRSRGVPLQEPRRWLTCQRLPRQSRV